MNKKKVMRTNYERTQTTKINFNLTTTTTTKTTTSARTTLGPERCNVCSKNRLKCKLNGNCASNWSGVPSRWGGGWGRGPAHTAKKRTPPHRAANTPQAHRPQMTTRPKGA